MAGGTKEGERERVLGLWWPAAQRKEKERGFGQGKGARPCGVRLGGGRRQQQGERLGCVVFGWVVAGGSSKGRARDGGWRHKKEEQGEGAAKKEKERERERTKKLTGLIETIENEKRGEDLD